jgi:hypothetical protein
MAPLESPGSTSPIIADVLQAYLTFANATDLDSHNRLDTIDPAAH